ncbi:MAG: ABC transporter permease [Chloroflexi bacterium]|nr:ABC transporter permease [Chloroflexota bacterium]
MTARRPDVADLLDEAPGAAVTPPDGSPEVAASVDGTVEAIRQPEQGQRRRGRAVAWLRAGARAGWPPLLVAVLALAVWEAWIRVRGVPDYLAPSPTAVADALLADPTRFLGAGAVSLQHAMGGLVLGAGGAFALGAVMAHSHRLERALYPFALMVKVTPIVAIAPLLIIWFGFGDAPKYVVAGLITFFPMLVNAVTGLRTVDAAAHDFFRAMDASRWQVFLRLRLPASLPYVFAALRISVPLALIGAVVAEWMSADSGVGQLIVIAHGDFDTPALFGAVVVLAAIGIALTGALALVERRLLFWHESVREW